MQIKKRLELVGVGNWDAYWDKKSKLNLETKKYELTGKKVYHEGQVYLSTNSEWTDLSIKQAKKLVKGLKKAIIKAEAEPKEDK